MTICSACGLEPPDGARFCPSCGAALADATASEEMLKLVTVLFADVVASTARANALHPEDMRDLMSDYFAAMRAEIEAEGGTIEKFVGDAIMAVFGVPAAHEDDPIRAVRAARRMLDRLRTWNQARDRAERVDIRIGVNTGEVVAAGAPRGDLLVTGDAVNVAARLQQAAEAGTLLVGERTARAVRPHFELRQIESLELKGKPEAVAAWQVEAEREIVDARGVPGLMAPLVGRGHELASLRTTFERVSRERRSELVTIVGDAGIGKSRLVREFLAPLDADAKVLIGRCLAYGQGVTLWPLGEMLKAEAVVLETDTTDVAFTKIDTLVSSSIDADLVGDSSRAAAALASTLGLRRTDDPLAGLDPRAVYRELLASWRALFSSLGRRGAVVAVVEDIHWADPTMLDVLDELAERVEGPILFVCTARSDLLRSRPDWGGGRRGFSSLPLDALTSEESARLVSLLLDVDELPERLRQRMLERSEGNPFFLEEIVRHLIDDGRLVRVDRGWRVRAGIDDVEIPDNVQAVILARLDLLAPEEKRVAQRAAVVGRVFWDGAAAALAGVKDLDQVLRTLRRREFVLEHLSSSIAGQAEFVFKHVLIRDVAYESLPRRERGRAHAQAAAWIEQTSGERAAELAELLAHHYDAAFSYLSDDELRQKARSRFLEAAANAHRRFAMEQGERFARRAVELSEGSLERVEALELLGDLHYHVGDAAWRAYVDALAELEEDDPASPRLAAKAAQYGARWVGTMAEVPEIEEVRRLIDAGLRAAAPVSRERASLLVARAFLLIQRELRPFDETDAAGREALEAAEELGDADLLSAALDAVTANLQRYGRYREMDRLTRRRIELVPRMTEIKEIGDSHAMAAWAAHHLGRYREAEEHATAAIERARGVDAGVYLHGLTWRIAARFMLGDWNGALADQTELERVSALDARERPAGYTMRAYAYAAFCHELRGASAEADAYIELALRYVRMRADLGDGGSVHLPPLSRALAHRGRFDDALRLIPLVRRSGSAGLTLESLSEIAAARERWDEAPGLVTAAREEAELGELLSVPPFADRLEGRAAAAAGDLDRAVSLLGRSAERFAALEARWEEAWSRLLLGEALVAVDASLAEREVGVALAVFEELGSVREAERARELLGDAAVERA
jgi:class 3 adenylate cyclase